MKKTILSSLLACSAFALHAETIQLPFFGTIPVVDKVDCTASDHRFEEHPAGASRVETVLGRPCRVLPVQEDTSAFLKWRLGEGRGLKPYGAYVVVVEYPDDLPRDYLVRNNGNNSRRSFYTGSAIGDAWAADIVGHHPESLRIPQSGRYELWTSLTFLGEKASERMESIKVKGDDGKEKDQSVRTDIATEGFDFILAQYKRKHHPESAGLAAARILLCEIPDEKALWANIPLPPAPLPRRHIFWREEMSDGVIKQGNLCPGDDGLAWYEQKFRTMKILGQNTFCKDLLEFGHNQDWDPGWRKGDGARPMGKTSWMWASHGPEWDVWSRIVPTAVDKYGLDIFPYYEYGGANGNWPGSLGPQKRSETLGGEPNYTHIWWSGDKLRVDVTDPDTLDEFQYILDGTILRFKEQVAKGGFVGAWLRPRPAQMAVSFSDATRKRFADEANGGKAVSRDDLKKDKALYARYIDWWGTKRAAFCEAIRDYLEQNGVKDAEVVLDNDPSEVGHGLHKRGGLVTDDPDAWRNILPEKDVVDMRDPAILREHLYLKALEQPSSTWGKWEWQHACPGADHAHYTGLRNVWMALSFHNLFSVNDPECFAAFRNANGTETLVRHYGLNEHMVKDAEGKALIGYAMADWERAGRACMIAEIEAMANGDPVNFGYLMGSNYARGFPGPVREFNINFLALPALPSKVVPDACDDPDVVVREIDCTRLGKGRYFAIVHRGWTEKRNVQVRLPGVREITVLESGRRAPLSDGTMPISTLPPWRLIAVHTP